MQINEHKLYTIHEALHFHLRAIKDGEELGDVKEIEEIISEINEHLKGWEEAEEATRQSEWEAEQRAERFYEENPRHFDPQEDAEERWLESFLHPLPLPRHEDEEPF